jgi:hypothetical protein
MHEHVHKWTRQEWQPNQEPEHMCPVLGEQQRARDDQETDQHKSSFGFNRHAFSGLLLMPKTILR